MTDVVVIGAGVVGCAVARELSRYDLRVQVLEKASDVAEGTTKANSAIIHAGYDAVPGTNKARFNVWGNELFEPLCRELGVPFRRNTSLVAGFSDEDRRALEALKARGEENGVPGLRVVSGDEARAIEPRMARSVTCALLAPTGGICCPYDLTFRLAENAAANGVEFLFNCGVELVERNVGQASPPVSHERAPARWRVIATGGRVFKARAVVNAAGLHADELNNQVSANKLTITPRRGEYLLFDKKYAGTFNATIFQVPTALGKGVLVSPTVEGTVILGPTVENIGDKADTRTTAEGSLKILKTAARVWEDLPRGGVIACFAGLRAHGDSRDFVLGEPEDAPGFYNAAAMESPGLTAAPAVGVWLAERIAKTLNAERSTFNVQRITHAKPFREMTDAERVSAIADDPAYGRIVCRCETVTEAEVRAAIRCRVGARTLDGVKRRTRAGMGRCQGGFCTPRVIAILCEELGLAPEQVTKFGGESWVMATPDTRHSTAGSDAACRESRVERREGRHD